MSGTTALELLSSAPSQYSPIPAEQGAHHQGEDRRLSPPRCPRYEHEHQAAGVDQEQHAAARLGTELRHERAHHTGEPLSGPISVAAVIHMQMNKSRNSGRRPPSTCGPSEHSTSFARSRILQRKRHHQICRGGHRICAASAATSRRRTSTRSSQAADDQTRWPPRVNSDNPPGLLSL